MGRKALGQAPRKRGGRCGLSKRCLMGWKAGRQLELETVLKAPGRQPLRRAQPFSGHL
jgi:hypothetical protein